MRALVVYESMFGNTEAVARQVAEGLSARMLVDVVEVSSAPIRLSEEVTLLVVGGPTHAFGMSRPKTRADAAGQAKTPLVSAGRGIREWLDEVTGSAAVSAAAFDTRVNKPRVPGSAAKAAQRRLRRKGFSTPEKPQTFYVHGTSGPLVDGETARARLWGETLSAQLAATS
jgi:hypothetical protein